MEEQQTEGIENSNSGSAFISKTPRMQPPRALDTCEKCFCLFFLYLHTMGIRRVWEMLLRLSAYVSMQV